MVITPLQRVLVVFACALSAVTVVTVWETIRSLIAVPWQAILFAGAFAAFDLVKYLLWPASRELYAAGRRREGSVLVGLAIALAGISAWATSDMLTNALMTRNAQHQAHQQRIANIEGARTADAQALDQLATEAAAIRTQADALRARGMATPALNLEAAALTRIDSQRDAARQRLDSSARELAELRATPAAEGMSLWLANLLGIGLALALEIIPAALLTISRGSHAPRVTAPGKPAPAARRDSRALRIISRASAARTVAA